MTSANPAAPAHRHLPKVVSLDLLHLRRDLQAVSGFNAKVALLLTRIIGTMWAFWAFNGIALVSLPSAIHQHSLTVLINWVSSNWIQLILLPALMVGQNLAAAASDARAVKTFQDTELVVDRLDTRTQGGLTEVLREVQGGRDDTRVMIAALTALLKAQDKAPEPAADSAPKVKSGAEGTGGRA